MIFSGVFGAETFDAAIAYRSLTYQERTLITEIVHINYSEDAYVTAHPKITYKMSARMGIPSPSYDMSAIIVLSDNDPRLSESWINAALWSYANELRKLSYATDAIVYRLKIIYCTGDDLDDHWGPMLGMRRKLNESNDSFRLRLITHISVLTSSGTAERCETVIDAIINQSGAAKLETYYPAEVKLVWDQPGAIKIAEAKNDLITLAMNEMIATGITWSTSYPYTEYRMDMYYLVHPEYISYDMDSNVTRRRGVNYHMSVNFFDVIKNYYEMDQGFIYLSAIPKTYKMRSKVVGEPLVTYSMGSNVLPIGQLYWYGPSEGV